MNLYDFAESLRKKADSIEKMMNDLQVPTQGRFSITESFAKLRLIVGDKFLISIHPPELSSYGGSSNLTAEHWTVYLGGETNGRSFSGLHEAPTLDAAVEKAVGAYHLAMNPDIANADASETVQAVTEAFSEQPPY